MGGERGEGNMNGGIGGGREIVGLVKEGWEKLGVNK